MISSQELEDKIKLLQQQLEEAQKKMVNIVYIHVVNFQVILIDC